MKELLVLIAQNTQLPTLSYEQVKEAIKFLPADNRKAITLRYLQNLSRKEIAVRLSWSPAKLHNKITRGITLLRKELNPAYFDRKEQNEGQELRASV